MSLTDQKKLVHSFNNKKVFRLDTNFHVYVHGAKDKFEEGVDKKGKYIKLYYNEIK
jgi:hypothetical protein